MSNEDSCFEFNPGNRLGRGLVKTQKELTLDVALHMLCSHTPTLIESSSLVPSLLTSGPFTQDHLGGPSPPTSCMSMSFARDWRRLRCLQVKARHSQGIIQTCTIMNRSVLSVDGKDYRDVWQGRILTLYVLLEYFPHAHLTPHGSALRGRRDVTLKIIHLRWLITHLTTRTFFPQIPKGSLRVCRTKLTFLIRTMAQDVEQVAARSQGERKHTVLGERPTKTGMEV